MRRRSERAVAAVMLVFATTGLVLAAWWWWTTYPNVALAEGWRGGGGGGGYQDARRRAQQAQQQQRQAHPVDPAAAAAAAAASVQLELDSRAAQTEFAKQASELREMVQSKRDVQREVLRLEEDAQDSDVPTSVGLNELCVLGAANAASSGAYVSASALLQLLELGVRFVDLEIQFDALKELPVVVRGGGGGGGAPKNALFISLLLSRLQTFIRRGGLGKSTTLFLQYRIRVPPQLSAKKRDKYFGNIVHYTQHYLREYLLARRVQPASFEVRDLLLRASSPSAPRVLLLLDTSSCPFADQDARLQALASLTTTGTDVVLLTGADAGASLPEVCSGKPPPWRIVLPPTSTTTTTPPEYNYLRNFAQTRAAAQVVLADFTVRDQALEDFLLLFLNGKQPYRLLPEVLATLRHLRHAHQRAG